MTVRSTGSGCLRATVRPVDENTVLNQTCGPDGHLHVIPARWRPRSARSSTPTSSTSPR
ncbi:hypothetical protein NKG94_06145 [Micromonospora sp. M12]